MTKAKAKVLLFESGKQQFAVTPDPLLVCLTWFTKYFHKPFSEDALTAGLPLVDHMLTPPLFVRAAERAQLVAQVGDQNLYEINLSMLPMILLLKDGKCCILLKINKRTKSRKVQVLYPEYGMGVTDTTLSVLEECYSGSVIYVTPAYKFSEHTDEKLITKENCNISQAEKVILSESQEKLSTVASDPLLTCLTWFAKHFDKPFSENTLIAELSLVDHKLTPPLFVLAAKRAQLAAQVSKQDLCKISQSMLPLVLLLKDGKSCILLKIDHSTESAAAQILYPEYGMGITDTTLSALEEVYVGSVILISPENQLSEQNDERLVTKETPNLSQVTEKIVLSESREQQSAAMLDPLLTCLVWFTKHFHKPFSEKALTAGLPLVDHKLTPPLFVRAAERAHLAAQVSKQNLYKINQSMLPMVLLLKDGKSCILLKVDQGAKLGAVQILYPEYGMGITDTTLSVLEESYIGSVIFIAPAYKFNERSDETLVTKENRNWFWSVMIKIWPVYSEVLIASLLINIFALVVPLFVMNVYNRVVPNHAIETLWVLASGVFIVNIFDFGMRLLRGYFIDVAGKSVDLRLSANIFEQILGIKMMSRPQSVGAFANTIQSFEAFREFITSSTVTILVDLPFAFLFIAVVGIIGGTLALVPLIMIPLVIFVGWLIQIPLTALTHQSYRYANEKQATLIESLSGVETIKSIGAESPMQRRWEHVTQLSAHLGIKLRFFANLNINFSLFVQHISYMIVIIWGVYKIANGDLTTGGLIACSILTSRAMSSTSQIAALLAKYYQSRYSLESLNKIMDLPVERPRGKSFVHRPVLEGYIEFRQVSFTYPQQTTPSLKSISFKIKPGEKVAIIGRIGSGKSTIAKLMLGLYQPTSGTVLLDNTEQQQIDLAELRHNMGYVPQDVMLFYGSVRENIVFGAPYVDDNAIIRAAAVSGVDQFVSRHPKGFDMQVGERGLYLSGGQRQEVAIARAFLLDPSVVIMDEPTNSMDDKTEASFKNLLSQSLQDKTLILVTHKGSMLNLVNRIIIMEAGQIVADGPKEDVIKALAEGKIRAQHA